MPTFQRKTGAQKDLAELCYVSALHQTGNDVRRDGSIRDADIALYLRSRHNVVVSEEDVREFILPGLAGTIPRGNAGSSNSNTCNSESADAGADDKEIAETALTSTTGTTNGGSNDDGAMDLAELTALLLIPPLVKLAEEHHTTATSSINNKSDGSDSDGSDDKFNDEDANAAVTNSADIIAATLDVILNDVASLQGYSAGDCDPANGVYPELTPELLRTILTTYGEEELADDDQLIDDMMAVAIASSVPVNAPVDVTSTSDEDRVGGTPESSSSSCCCKVRLEPATFARLLTADLGLLHSADENRVSTNYQDVLAAAVDSAGHDAAVKKSEEHEEDEDVETGSSSTYFDLPRFRFSTSSIDFAAGRYASKAMAAFLWASFVMFVFAELVIGGDLSAYTVTYILFIQNSPCQYVAFADSIGNPEMSYYHTFPDGTTYEDWVEPCADYTESFWLKIGKSTTVWLYRFVVFMLYGVGVIGFGSLGNNTEPGRCWNRRFAATIGILSLITSVFIPFIARMRGQGLCTDCYSDDAAFRFLAIAYFIFTALVICILLAIILGLNKIPKLQKIIDSEVYSEQGMKQAGNYKTIEMMKNMLVLHGKTISASDQKGSSLGTALLNYFTSEETESVGGFCWCWRNYLNGNLFHKEGISISGRILAINLVQLCVAIYVLIGGILLWRLMVYLWSLGVAQIDGLVDAIIERFNLQDLISDISQKVDASSVCTDLPDPAVCDTIKDYVSGDAIQAFVSSIVYSTYPSEQYMISVPFIVYAVVASGSSLILFLLYVPSVYRTIIKFRCGSEPLFSDNARFKMYRNRVDMTTQLLGTIFWTGIFGPVILGALAMLLTFFLLWQTTRPLLLSIVAAIIGVMFAVILKEIVAVALMKTSYQGFYRRRVTRNNIGSLALETVTIGLGVFYAVARVGKILIVTILYISRIDTDLLSLDLHVGPLEDKYPRFFRQALLLQESHKHPWLEVLGKMYLMKYRYREKFISSAGYTYRLIFALSLMPYLRKFRLTNRKMDQDGGEGLSKAFKFPIPRKSSKRATEVTAIDRIDSAPLIGGSSHSDDDSSV